MYCSGKSSNCALDLKGSPVASTSSPGVSRYRESRYREPCINYDDRKEMSTRLLLYGTEHRGEYSACSMRIIRMLLGRTPAGCMPNNPSCTFLSFSLHMSCRGIPWHHRRHLPWHLPRHTTEPFMDLHGIPWNPNHNPRCRGHWDAVGVAITCRGIAMKCRGSCRGGGHSTTHGMPRHPPRRQGILCHAMG